MGNRGAFLVMRLAPMIGRPESALRISVAQRASRLDWALMGATDGRDYAARTGRRGGYWIAKAGQPAHRTIKT